MHTKERRTHEEPSNPLHYWLRVLARVQFHDNNRKPIQSGRKSIGHELTTKMHGCLRIIHVPSYPVASVPVKAS